MQHRPLYRTVLTLLTLGALVGSVVFIGSAVVALYLSVATGRPGYVVHFFMSGLPLFSGASAMLLGFTMRSHIRRGGSRGTSLIAVYSVVYMLLIFVVALFALYAPDS